MGGGSVEQVARAAKGIPFQVQDESAQLVTLFAAGGLGDGPVRVLDLCAAPGGKAFHLAEILPAGSEVVAVEIHPRKADALRREAERRGLPGIRVICADGSKPIPGLEPASFDAVLVDAPCSGLGTLRRHPELKLRRTAADLPRFADLQEAILPERARLREARGAGDLLGLLALPGRGARGGGAPRRRRPPRSPASGIPADTLTAEGDLLTLPDLHGGDGFYAARLVH